MPTRLGTSRWVKVIVPILSGGMSLPLAPRSGPTSAWAWVNTDAGPSGENAAAAVNPAPATNVRRLSFLSDIATLLRGRSGRMPQMLTTCGIRAGTPVLTRSAGGRQADPRTAELDPVEVEEVVPRPAVHRPEHQVDPVSAAGVGDGEGLARVRGGVRGGRDCHRREQRPVDGVEVDLDRAGAARGTECQRV